MMRKEIGKIKCKDMPSCVNCVLWRYCVNGMTEVDRTLENILRADASAVLPEKTIANIEEELKWQSVLLEEDKKLAERIKARLQEMFSDVEYYDEDYTNSTLEFYAVVEGAQAKFEFSATNAFQNEKNAGATQVPEWIIEMTVQKVPEIDEILSHQTLDIEDLEELEAFIKTSRENYITLHQCCMDLIKEFKLLGAIS